MAFKPEVWSAQALTSLRKTLVYAGPQVVNHDYEGEIKKIGDTVHVKMIGDVTVSTYNSGDTLTYEDVADAEATLKVDQSDKFSFKVDDIDRAQAGDEMAQRMDVAAYNMASKVDQYVAGFYTQVQSANVIGSTAITTGDAAYNGLINLGVKLDEANVPDIGRYVIVPPWYYGLLLTNDKFVRVDASGGSEGLRNGRVGQVDNMLVLKSNNVPIISGDDYAVTAGVKDAISFADQFAEVETLRLESTFATAVRGLHLYGAKVLRPDAMAVLTASKS
ncbi:P22 phage major capsid protein family protein [Streptomyces ossamyceticus]|uniref:P22 phage major capsid protein family protein n=1 Tax=Streptomyces ossamyceticus TaxID=249581 RepID=A0ABV2V4W6_9ACTN